MNLWDEIKTAVLLGTERQPFAPTPTDGALGDLLAGLSDKPAEERLLAAAGAVALYRRAGRLPTVDPEPTPAASLPEELPLCSPIFAQYLTVMLGGARRDVLPEALHLLAAADKRVPALLLPDLLTAGAQQKDLRESILAVIGQRGRWLGARNADWKFADATGITVAFAQDDSAPELTEDIKDAWQLGSREGRGDLLKQIRAQYPEMGRLLLETTWDSDGAEDKTAFLPLLATRLSMADEPFLEAALDSRGKEVRRAAADLLVRIPESRLVERMVERAAPLLNIKRSLLGKLSLDVTVPTEFDKVFLRDGIEEKGQFGTLGDKAWWLTQILGAIPPGYWSKTFGQPPSKLIETVAKSEWADAVLLGWGKASLRSGQIDWIDEIARHWLAAKAKPAFPRDFLPGIADMSGGAEAVIFQAMETDTEPLNDSHPALAMLSQYTRPWSADLSRAVVQSLMRRVPLGIKQGQTLYRTSQSIRQFAHYVPVGLAGELSQGWPSDHENWQAWRNSIEEFLNILQFRYELHKEIRS